MHCFLPMVVPVVERLERRGCYMIGLAVAVFGARAALETLNENMAESAQRRVWRRPTTDSRGFASEAISLSVRPNLAVYEASQFKR